MIYISTGGFHKQSASETALSFWEYGIDNVELSGGKSTDDNLEKLLTLSEKINFQVHNYFPPPKIPFVLNLASMDAEISKKSIQHIIEAMQLALDLGCPRYSFHAGFLLDPKVRELGQKLTELKLYERRLALQIFIERLNFLSEKARALGVELLVENNVVSKSNFQFFNKNPFLMAEADECKYVMENTPSNINLLIDLAHLKVSSNSLSFDKAEFLEKCDPWILGYHLSDNDGFSDSNNCVLEDSWFWPYLKKNLNYYSLEVYREPYEILCTQLDLAKRKLI